MKRNYYSTRRKVTFDPQIQSIQIPSRKFLKKKTFQCVICLGMFAVNQHPLYNTDHCDHAICHACIRHYFNSIVKKNNHTTLDSIPCPFYGCKETFKSSSETFAGFFSEKEIDAWWKAALGSKAYIKNRVYCPMQGCGALLDVDDELTKECKFSECQACHKGICVVCQTAWHPGVIKVKRDDVENTKNTLDIAKQGLWCRCPKCSYIVEKQGGCSFVYCPCGSNFCYQCGGNTCRCSIDPGRFEGYFDGIKRRRTDMFEYKPTL